MISGCFNMLFIYFNPNTPSIIRNNNNTSMEINKGII